MKILVAVAAAFTLTACAGFGAGVGSYEDDQVKAYYIGIGIKSDSKLPIRPNADN